jgi:hypothetical protein
LNKLETATDSEKLLSKYIPVQKGVILLLIIVGVEPNAGPGVESESFMRVICSVSERRMYNGTERDLCGL